MVKIAECLAYSNPDEAHSIIPAIKQYKDNEINTYIDKYFNYNDKKQNAKDSSIKDMIGKVEFYQTAFPEGVEERYRKMTAQIEKNIFT